MKQKNNIISIILWAISTTPFFLVTMLQNFRIPNPLLIYPLCTVAYLVSLIFAIIGLNKNESKLISTSLIVVDSISAVLVVFALFAAFYFIAILFR